MTWYQFYGAIVIRTGVNDTVVFHDGTADRTATIAAGVYFIDEFNVGGDNFMEALEAAITAAPSSLVDLDDHYITSIDVNPANRGFRITMDATGPWTLKETGTFDLSLIGFHDDDLPLASSGGANSITSVRSATSVWIPSQPFAFSRPRYFRHGAQVTRSTGATTSVTLSSQVELWDFGFRFIDGRRINEVEADSGTGTALSTWLDIVGDGRLVRVYDSEIDAGSLLFPPVSSADIGSFLPTGTIVSGDFAPQRAAGGLSRWDVTLPMRRYVAI